MTVHYHAAIEKLASAVRNEATDNNIAPEITAAMAPLDPRLGDGSEGLGIEYLLKNVTVQHIFPMHMWKSMSHRPLHRRAPGRKGHHRAHHARRSAIRDLKIKRKRKKPLSENE